jgi:hypothetical protein
VCVIGVLLSRRRRRETTTNAVITPMMHSSPTTPPTMLAIRTTLSATGDGTCCWGVELERADVEVVVALDAAVVAAEEPGVEVELTAELDEVGATDVPVSWRGSRDAIVVVVVVVIVVVDGVTTGVGATVQDLASHMQFVGGMKHCYARLTSESSDGKQQIFQRTKQLPSELYCKLLELTSVSGCQSDDRWLQGCTHHAIDLSFAGSVGTTPPR